MTLAVGANDGNIFSYNPIGNIFTNLINFNPYGPDTGKSPYGSLTLSGGILYGMTSGPYHGNIFSYNSVGNVYTNLLNFTGTGFGEDSASDPIGSLTLSGGVFYGMTEEGGIGDGNIFSYSPVGNVYTNLYNWIYTVNGAFPEGTLTLSQGILFGMTYEGGTNNNGVIFKYVIDTNITTSVNEVRTSEGVLNAYPNPNNGIFTIQSSVISNQLAVEIYNVMGQKVLTETLRSTQGDNLINLAGQPNGLYFYRVLSETGALIGDGKVIIQK